MGLRLKVTLIVTVVLGGLLAGNLLIQAVAVYPSFVELERHEAMKDWERCRDAIELEIAGIMSLNIDWAFWDDTQKYVQGLLPGYYEENLQRDEWFVTQNIDAMLVVQPDGTVFWGRCTLDDDMTPVELSLLPADRLPRDHPLMQVTESKDSSISGLILTEHGPMMVAASPIIGSNYEPPMTGVLIFGRFLDAQAVEPMVERMQIQFTAQLLDSQDLSPADRVQAEEAAESNEPRIADAGDHLQVAGVLDDLWGRPMLVIQTDFAKAITAQGARAIFTAMLTQTAAAAATVLTLVVLLHVLAVRPLLRLTRHVTDVGESDSLHERLKMDRADEIGQLARGFDRMMDQLEASRNQALSMSRQAGMAEVATGVLHNVGNALNSINVSAGVISDSLRTSKLTSLGKLVGLISQEKGRLGEFVTQDDRGKCLPQFLETLHQKLRDDHETLQKEVEQLTAGLDHVKQVVRMQQSTAESPQAVVTPTDPATLMDDALKVNMLSLNNQKVQITREYEPGLAHLPLDRHKVLQVLINLISNARKATCRPDVADPRITLRVGRADDGKSLRFQVQDTGIGIEPDDLVRVFRHGGGKFDAGHGAGLHANANAAAQMNGQLTAHSDGPRTGATFTLTIPIPTPAAPAHAASAASRHH